MKLKGKLFTSFGSVLLCSLVVLGVIIQYSFTENTIRNGEEILRLKTDNLALLTKIDLTQHTDNIQDVIYSIIDDGKLAKDRLSEIENALSQILHTWHLLDGIFIADVENQQILAYASKHIKNSYKIPPHKIQLTDNPLALSTIGDKLLLIWLPVPSDSSIIAAIELNRKKFTNLLTSLYNINHSCLFLTDKDNQLVLKIDRYEDKNCSNVDYKTVDATAHGIIPIPNTDNYLYRHKVPFFGLQASLLITEDYFLNELHSLKNRIVIGILIVGWVLIWVILIFAHRISSPITNLSQATHDIIVLNYDTELKIPKSKDEIGDLYENFETMRLKLKNLITTDSLTNVYNRRYLMHVFDIEAIKAHRLDQKLSCIIFDLDFFKEVNDRYGHQCGDATLKEIGRILLETTRPYDTPARYGGEEFILLLPETDLEHAYTIAERLRRKVESWEMPYNGNTIKCTISLGVAGFDPHDANTTDSIIGTADYALYEAKRTGRNRTVLYEKGMSICHDCTTITNGKSIH